jgi:hypothetical protein
MTIPPQCSISHYHPHFPSFSLSLSHSAPPHAFVT